MTNKEWIQEGSIPGATIREMPRLVRYLVNWHSDKCATEGITEEQFKKLNHTSYSDYAVCKPCGLYFVWEKTNK